MAELLTYENNNNSYTDKSFLRDGIAGNYDVVFQMVRLVRQTTTYNKSFQNFVNKLLIDKGFDKYTNDEQKFKLIFDFVNENVTYLEDIAGHTESIKSADVTLSDGYGDCDDLSILYASMLGVLGFEPKFILATYRPTETQFAHVYVECNSKEGKLQRFVFDGAIPNGSFNREIKPLKTVSIDIFNQNETDGITGLLKQIGFAFKHGYKGLLDTVPTIASFTPIGAVAYTALTTGASLASAGLDSNLSLNELGSKIHRQLDTIIDGLFNKQIAADYARISARQIASQLTSYPIDSHREQVKYKSISNSIKNKIHFIDNYIKENNYDVTLNHKGMVLGGALVLSYFGYQAYKHFNK
jgi:predicted transglutaminase-like cysteine proteinase